MPDLLVFSLLLLGPLAILGYTIYQRRRPSGPGDGPGRS